MTLLTPAILAAGDNAQQAVIMAWQMQPYDPARDIMDASVLRRMALEAAFRAMLPLVVEECCRQAEGPWAIGWERVLSAFADECRAQAKGD